LTNQSTSQLVSFFLTALRDFSEVIESSAENEDSGLDNDSGCNEETPQEMLTARLF
jgi:hypothetical protein